MNEVAVGRVIRASSAAVYGAFIEGTVFDLTGASSFTSAPRAGGAFRLMFDGRGTVTGEFLELLFAERVRLTWDVSGFGRPDEKTVVVVGISGAGDESRIEVRHSGVGSPESAAAKTSSWESILVALEAHLLRQSNGRSP
jgi:hypothetical protein